MIIEFRGEYNFLSNFAAVNIPYDKNVYPSVEHFYVAMKTKDTESRKKISKMTAAEAKKFGRQIVIREDWDRIKLAVMEWGLKIKFSNLKMKNLLLATGDENIQEGNYWNDTFWGIDLKQNPNIGENHLGRLLMKVRKEIQGEHTLNF